jgi:hypothetical protein
MVWLLWTLVLMLGVTGWMSRLDAFWGDERVEAAHSFLADVLLVAVILHLAGVAVMSCGRRTCRRRWSPASGVPTGTRAAADRVPLRAVLGARTVDFSLDDHVMADHARKWLCFDEAIRAILRADCSADNPRVADTDNALPEIYDAWRGFKRVGRAVWIGKLPSQVGFDDVLIIICQPADRHITAAAWVGGRTAGPK